MVFSLVRICQQPCILVMVCLIIVWLHCLVAQLWKPFPFSIDTRELHVNRAPSHSVRLLSVSESLCNKNIQEIHPGLSSSALFFTSPP